MQISATGPYSLSQANQFHILTFQFFRVNFSIILPFKPRFSKCSLVTNQNFICISLTVSCTLHVPLSFPFWSDCPNNIWRELQLMTHLVVEFFPAFCYSLPLQIKIFSSLHSCQKQIIVFFLWRCSTRKGEFCKSLRN